MLSRAKGPSGTGPMPLRVVPSDLNFVVLEQLLYQLFDRTKMAEQFKIGGKTTLKGDVREKSLGSKLPRHLHRT